MDILKVSLDRFICTNTLGGGAEGSVLHFMRGMRIMSQVLEALGKVKSSSWADVLVFRTDLSLIGKYLGKRSRLSQEVKN